MSCELIREHGAAYAFGALETEEREAVEAHARDCPGCARELAELEQATARIALGVPQVEPPAELGRRLVAVAQREARTRPLPIAEAGPAVTSGGVPVGRRTRPRAIPWLSIGTLAAALAALIWAGVLQAQLAATQQQLADTSGRYDRLRAAYDTVVHVLASPDTRERDLQAREGAPGARGKVWVDHDSGLGMLMARDLPPLPEGQTYQVWLSNPQGRVSGGFLRPYEEEIYYVVLQAPGRLTDYQSVGVTLEPVGGSAQPTGPRIVGGEL